MSFVLSSNVIDVTDDFVLIRIIRNDACFIENDQYISPHSAHTLLDSNN